MLQTRGRQKQWQEEYMPTLTEKMEVYRLAALKGLIQKFDNAQSSDLDAAIRLYNGLSSIMPDADMIWILRSTELSKGYSSYREMYAHLHMSEHNLHHPLIGMSEQGLAVAIAAMHSEIKRLIDFNSDYLTWDDQEGFDVVYRMELGEWWLRHVQVNGGPDWILSLGSD